MNNKELSFNLIKNLESKEIEFSLINNLDNNKIEYYLVLNVGIDKDGSKLVKRIKLSEEVSRDSFGVRCLPYNPNWNKAFKENFYKEKGLNNCWYKDCSNKIYQKEGDYKAVNILCQEKHKRIICSDCYEKKHKK